MRRMRPRLVVAAAAAVAVAAGARRAAADPRPEDVVGTWRGAATWKGCTVAGGRTAAVVVHYAGGAYAIELAGARDDLGTVTLAPDGDHLAGTLRDLTVTMKPGRRATVTLATTARCLATLTVTRDGSGIAACDRLVALRDVASTCEAAGDDRAAALTAARGRLAGWKKLRGAKKAAAARACGKDADALAATLTTQTCLPSPDAPGSTGVPECDAYIATLERYVQCAKVPVEAKQAVQQAIPQLLDGWKQLRDPGVAPEVRRATADACRQAAGALRQAAAQTGCTVP